MRALVGLVVRNRKRSAIVAAAMIVSVGAALTASDEDKRAEWRHYLGGQDSASYSTLNQINRSNVTGLEVAWTYKAGANNRLRFNPIVVDDVMYVLGKDRAIVALDAATGKPLWAYEHDPLFQRDITDRGINYWESKDRSQRRLLFAAKVSAAIRSRLSSSDSARSAGTPPAACTRISSSSDLERERPMARRQVTSAPST